MSMTLGSVTQSVITNTANGLLRSTALMTCVASNAQAIELVVRGLGTVWTTLFGNSRLKQPIEFIRASGIRPLGQLNDQGDYMIPTSKLIQDGAVTMVAGIILWETATVLCGPAPAIYNYVLTCMGPFRLVGTPYLGNVKNLLS